MAYQKQTWRDYDDSKTELQNVSQGAVVTPERLNHMETGIANSADKAEVTAQLQHKADTTYVDEKVQGVSLAYKESYDTLSLLQTAYPNGDNFNHTVLDDGMIYTYKNGWISTGIQANGTGLAPNSVTENKTTFISPSQQNLFNPEKATDGYRLDSVGNPHVDGNSTLSDFIPVKNGDIMDFYISGDWARLWRVALYDNNKNFISKGLDTEIKDILQKMVITSDGYIRVAVDIDAKYRFQVAKYSARDGYRPFVEEIDEKIIPLVNKKIMSEGNNLLDGAGWVSGHYKSTDYFANENFNVADFIQVMPNRKYYYKGFGGNGDGLRWAAFYDANKNHLSAINFNTLTDKNSFQTPANTKYISVTTYKTNTNHVLADKPIAHFVEDELIKKEKLPSLAFDMFEGGSIPQETKDNFSSLYDKSILNFGDSIAQGGANGGISYAEIIGDKYEMTVTNKAVGGASIIYNSDRSVIKEQIEQAITDGLSADYILFNGLTNDANLMVSRGQSLGSITEGYDDIFDMGTFCGAFEETCRLLQENYSDKKIVYVAVHKMSNIEVNNFEIITEKAKEVCRKWSIPIVDIHGEGGLNTFISGMSEAYTANADTKHPNQLGYELFYVPRIASKMESI